MSGNEAGRKDILNIYGTALLSLSHRGGGACMASSKLSPFWRGSGRVEEHEWVKKTGPVWRVWRSRIKQRVPCHAQPDHTKKMTFQMPYSSASLYSSISRGSLSQREPLKPQRELNGKVLECSRRKEVGWLQGPGQQGRLCGPSYQNISRDHHDQSLSTWSFQFPMSYPELISYGTGSRIPQDGSGCC